MSRRTDFQAAKTYTGQKIKGDVVVAYKIDGVRILYRDGKFVTRNNKVPPGLNIALTQEAKDKIEFFGDCEVYKGNFFKSNSPLQRHDPAPGCIRVDDIYPLIQTSLDARLYIGTVNTIKEKDVQWHLENALKLGYEGLVLRTENHWYRVKPHATADVYITGFFEQLDKNKNPKNQLGGFDTNWGKVTAFSDEMRKLLWDNPGQYIGKMITVQYKERYHTGKFRYAVKFLNFRDDKLEESFDTEPPEE